MDRSPSLKLRAFALISSLDAYHLHSPAFFIKSYSQERASRLLRLIPNTEHASETLILKTTNNPTSTQVLCLFFPLTQGGTCNCKVVGNHMEWFLFSFRTKTSASLPRQQTWHPWHPTPPTLSSGKQVQPRPLPHNTAVDFANTASRPSLKHRLGEGLQNACFPAHSSINFSVTNWFLEVLPATVGTV